ncbi:NrtR DNA-binding winged helix domain-containing protein [Emticicia sp. BO119]|uniref:NUDIX hydrolase n=1 Tax=Emticicia sp. BO119 TaxID=2757768 RepID=UPI0015F0D509|nr:NUDIX domain-containing protein [Emticicia sp. BO119]MBA4852237.1 NUDIX hydrolase [Emticicia sp. BO119]
MTENPDLREYWEASSMLLPSISIDCAIFGFHDNQLKILLLKYKNTDFFALPGGFINQDENLEDAAARILEERTRLKDIYLEQFYVFGDKSRRFDKIHHQLMSGSGLKLKEGHFLLNRFISVGYYALIDFSKATPVPDILSDSCQWYDLETVPSLIFDHDAILNKALRTLRSNIDEKLIGLNLLPETFTMNEFQNLYETILGEKIARSNFQRKVLGMHILKRLDKKITGGAHKAPYLYSFDNKGVGK